MSAERDRDPLWLNAGYLLLQAAEYRTRRLAVRRVWIRVGKIVAGVILCLITWRIMRGR